MLVKKMPYMIHVNGVLAFKKFPSAVLQFLCYFLLVYTKKSKLRYIIYEITFMAYTTVPLSFWAREFLLSLPELVTLSKPN